MYLFFLLCKLGLVNYLDIINRGVWILSLSFLSAVPPLLICKLGLVNYLDIIKVFDLKFGVLEFQFSQLGILSLVFFFLF